MRIGLHGSLLGKFYNILTVMALWTFLQFYTLKRMKPIRARAFIFSLLTNNEV